MNVHEVVINTTNWIVKFDEDLSQCTQKGVSEYGKKSSVWSGKVQWKEFFVPFLHCQKYDFSQQINKWVNSFGDISISVHVTGTWEIRRSRPVYRQLRTFITFKWPTSLVERSPYTTSGKISYPKRWTRISRRSNNLTTTTPFWSGEVLPYAVENLSV